MTKVVDFMGSTYVAEVINDEVIKIETLEGDRFLPCEFLVKEEREQFVKAATAKLVLPYEQL